MQTVNTLSCHPEARGIYAECCNELLKRVVKFCDFDDKR